MCRSCRTSFQQHALADILLLAALGIFAVTFCGCWPHGRWRKQVLYDFCMARSDLRGAAAAQLAWARRLRSEAPNSAQTADALGAYPMCTYGCASRGGITNALGVVTIPTWKCR